MGDSQPANLKPGLHAELRQTVEARHTARHLGSGEVEVFATPAMIALMERAAVQAADHLLPAGKRTVGIRVDVRHTAPTPLGMTVTARAELTAIEGRTLTFHVTAADEREQIGAGTHQRAIIDVEKFTERVRLKR
jgi:fluoroacetyl-CoA thioesterase